jgi:hypothetical protein
MWRPHSDDKGDREDAVTWRARCGGMPVEDDAIVRGARA